jgi:predicted GNAT family acetyltransferase
MKIKHLFKESIDSWANQIESKYDLKVFFVAEHKDKIKLSSIIVKPEDSGNGTGSKVMQELCDYADKNQKTIILTPAVKDDKQGTTSQSRLIDFYKKFDFVLNKGRKKDFTISELMYRLPK